MVYIEVQFTPPQAQREAHQTVGGGAPTPLSGGMVPYHSTRGPSPTPTQGGALTLERYVLLVDGCDDCCVVRQLLRTWYERVYRKVSFCLVVCVFGNVFHGSKLVRRK